MNTESVTAPVKKITLATAKGLVRKHCAGLVTEVDSTRLTIWFSDKDGVFSHDLRERGEAIAETISAALGGVYTRNNGYRVSIYYKGDPIPRATRELMDANVD